MPESKQRTATATGNFSTGIRSRSCKYFTKVALAALGWLKVKELRFGKSKKTITYVFVGLADDERLLHKLIIGKHNKNRK